MPTREEHPPLGKPFITGYDSNDLAFPIIAISKDPRPTGYAIPARGSNSGLTQEFITAYPNNKFDHVERVDETRSLWIYLILPGPVLSGLLMSDQANAALATTSSQVLDESASVYSPTWRTLSYSDVPLDANRKKRSVVTLAGSAFPPMVDYEQDPILGYTIKTTYQIVEAASVSEPTVTDGFIKIFKHIDDWRSLHIVEDHRNLTGIEYDEQRFDAANYPSLWDYTQYEWTSTCGAFSTKRDGFSAMVKSRLHVSFPSDVEEIDGLTLIPNSIHLGNGIQETNILNDDGSLTYSGDCTGTVEFPESTPSFTEYTGTIQGTEQLITGECVLFRAGYYKKTELYRVML